MSPAGRRMCPSGMPATVIAGHQAGLQRLHLLERDQCVHVLFRLFVDLPDLLLPLLRTAGRLGASRLDLRARPPLDCAAFLHRRLRDPRLLPARHDALVEDLQAI